MTPTPSQRRGSTAFEIEIETTWCRLLALKPMQRRTVCLSPNTGTLVLRWPRLAEFPGEVGTFNRQIELADFRAACFETLEAGRKRR